MASRNRTLIYLQHRNERKNFRMRVGGGYRDGPESKTKLLGKDEYELNSLDKKDAVTLGIPPGWMSIVDDVNYDISRIKSKMQELSECHKNHLLPQFGSDKFDDEQTIEILTEHITKLFHQAQVKVQRMEAEKISEQEVPIRKNIQSQLAIQLQDLSVDFRKNQKDYLQRLRGRQQKGKVLFQIEEGDGEDDSKFDVSFTQDQLKAANMSQDTIAQREKEIIQIAKSINELASIFKDLAVLVIEQGTILDRIDYNIEQTSHNTSQAVEQLVSASKSQKSYRNKLCMLLLCLSILVMVVLVFIRGFT